LDQSILILTFESMTKRKKIFRITGFSLLVIFIIIQFIRPERNTKVNENEDLAQIASSLQIPAPVNDILKTACFDCHSNYTVYPWYSNIQPAGWWLQGHINDGKKALNFSIFTQYRLYRQYHKLESIIKLVKKDAMPLPSYLIIHKDAKLDDAKKKAIYDWANARLQDMRDNNPPDSLVNPQDANRKTQQ
jgi:hypothetical protein